MGSVKKGVKIGKSFFPIGLSKRSFLKTAKKEYTRMNDDEAYEVYKNELGIKDYTKKKEDEPSTNEGSQE